MTTVTANNGIKIEDFVPDACKGIFGYLFSHKFEARYVYVEEPNLVVSELTITMFSLHLIDVSKLRRLTYCGDICVRCGCSNKRVSLPLSKGDPDGTD